MFSEPAALLFFVTETLRNGEPLQGFFEFTAVRGDDSGQSGGQLRSHRDLALALVREMKKLRDDFGSTFLLIELGRFEDRSIPFDKAISSSDFAPAGENIVSLRTICGQKIAKTGKSLH